MADAQASGACSRKAVWVQVPSPASLKRSSEKSEDLFLVLIRFSHPPYPLGQARKKNRGAGTRLRFLTFPHPGFSSGRPFFYARLSLLYVPPPSTAGS